VDPYKIADLQENDTAAHLLDLSSIVSQECMALILVANRISGSGAWMVYPRSHATAHYMTPNNEPVVITIKDQEVKWKNSAANDDWDVFLLGYFVEKRTR